MLLMNRIAQSMKWTKFQYKYWMQEMKIKLYGMHTNVFKTKFQYKYWMQEMKIKLYGMHTNVFNSRDLVIIQSAEEACFFEIKIKKLMPRYDEFLDASGNHVTANQIIPDQAAVRQVLFGELNTQITSLIHEVMIEMLLVIVKAVISSVEATLGPLLGLIRQIRDQALVAPPRDPTSAMFSVAQQKNKIKEREQKRLLVFSSATVDHNTVSASQMRWILTRN
ncbi:hypothetical protein Tcan_15188 [Toxocara canis]|uniref:Uncharacterized protein n=1 Tax=Toxocara canis TaxID=6265 RepID=A0A0B2UVS7_TOXCA|nr:hypothetical protein Tcan_15188 [Toxocara canis]